MRITASTTICAITQTGTAPTARRIPISGVRSRTTMSMMFDTPIAPAARVPRPTSHISAWIPVKRPWTFRNSSSMS